MNGAHPSAALAAIQPVFADPELLLLAGVITTLASGNWCNPPGSGLGTKPTASTGVPLLDAYLWVKTRAV